MTEDKPTLKGKLNGQVYKGDIVLLHSTDLDISGYVLDFDSKRITLSHEDPFTSSTGIGGTYDRRFRRSWGRGDKTYNLGCFESYEVLKKYPTQTERE
jgi:hypothetical protein